MITFFSWNFEIIHRMFNEIINYEVKEKLLTIDKLLIWVKYS